ncbi:uncharacterized protein LOC128545947 [Mercenaria mercenaria]|uniref:uncharacterized protein LOC128545947 n=1 Tax=Mercenaria mercenaria TaxID=6596 RepID=UPI00234F1C3B|nr:uncharacterized protein LOC128545947 [Mercenaria mercenaria]
MSKHKPAVSGSQSLPLTLLTLPDSSDTTVTLCESETEGLIFTPSLTVSEAVSESLQLTPLTPVNVTPFTDFQPSLNHSESVHSLELDTADSDTSTQSPSPHPELERCFSPDLFSDEEHKEHSTDTDSDSSTLPSSPTFTLKRSLWRNKVPYFPDWFNIVHDEDDAVYTYHQLQNDVEQADLVILV